MFSSPTPQLIPKVGTIVIANDKGRGEKNLTKLNTAHEKSSPRTCTVICHFKLQVNPKLVNQSIQK